MYTTMYTYIPWLVSRGLSDFSAAEAAMAFHLDGCFVREDDVKEPRLGLVQVLLRPLQPLGLIGFPNHLAVRAASVCPPQFAAATKNGHLRERVSLVS